MRFTQKVEIVELKAGVSDGMGGFTDGEEVVTKTIYGNLVLLDKLTTIKEYGIEVQEPCKLFVRCTFLDDTILKINNQNYSIQSALLQHNIKVYLLGAI